MSRALAGRRIWLTRPAHQTADWARAIEAAGATAVCEPLLAIEPPARADAALRGLQAAADAQALIATSSNAVRGAWQLDPGFAPRGRLYAVGAATAAALERASGRRPILPDAGFSSEAVLALPSLNTVRDQRIALLSGEGGRTALQATLRARGARVDKVAVYRRRLLEPTDARLEALLSTVDAVVVTSGEALAHLVALAGARHADALAALQLVAPSARVVKQAGHAPVWTHPPAIVEHMSGEAVVDALAQVWQGNRE